MISYFLETKILKLEVIENGLKKAEEVEDNLSISGLLVSEIAEREILENESI